jgi:uncharacterized protein (DUF433 family)
MGNVVMRDPEVLGGEPVFAGTRVAIKSLFEHLEAAGIFVSAPTNHWPSRNVGPEVHEQSAVKLRDF